MRAVPAGKSTIILRPAVDHSGIFLTETKERDGGGIGSPPGRPGWPLRRTRVEASRTLRTGFLQAKKIDIPSLSAHHARLLHLPTSAAHIFPPTPSRIYILSPPFFWLFVGESLEDEYKAKAKRRRRIEKRNKERSWLGKWCYPSSTSLDLLILIPSRKASISCSHESMTIWGSSSTRNRNGGVLSSTSNNN